MSLVTPFGVQDETQTSGTADYSLDDSTATGRRSLANAVTDGDAANSDTIYYVVYDDTTTGSSLEFEYGLGTVSSGGAAVSRDTIISSSNSDAKVSWGAGGTRTFLVVTGAWLLSSNDLSDVSDADTAADNIGAARLNAINSFVPDQEIKGTGNTSALDIGGSRTTTGITGILRFTGLDDGSNRENFALITGNIDTRADGSEDGSLAFRVMDAGTLTEHLTLGSDGTLTAQPSGNTYDAFPSGQELLSGTTPPTGWTRVNEGSGRVVKLAESGDTIGATAGTDDLFGGSWTTEAHTLTISQIPSHSHTTTASGWYFSTLAGGGQDSFVRNTDGNLTENDTGSAGGGSGHFHDMSAPLYRILVRMTKD